jgi:hypothetical protein
MDMVKLEKYQGFSADLAGAGCILISSLTGIPVSTTHTKTTAIMGVGSAKRVSNVNWGVVRENGAHVAAYLPRMRVNRIPDGDHIHAYIIRINFRKKTLEWNE